MASQQKPLSEILRPKTLSDVVGQEHLTGPHGLLFKLMENKHPASILLFGPPGCGKTTIAKLYSKAFHADFYAFSAVTEGTTELKKILKDAKEHPLLHRKIILFIDEVHRFNKAQQDLFLPFIEDGSVIFIGATTENPSFAINNALLSRVRVLELHPLSSQALMQILDRFALQFPKIAIQDKARDYLMDLANGDARYLINLLEDIAQFQKEGICEIPDIEKIRQKKVPLYDKQGEYHYNLISALHKSVRGSDPDAALYWLSRMLIGGEDPNFLFRRMVRMAKEDIGLADPFALQLALSCWDAYNRLGSPEGDLALAEAIVYLSLAPKSNAIYTSFQQMRQFAESTAHLPPPKCILNAPTKLMKDLGYGEGYIYDHDIPEGFSGQNYFPDAAERQDAYFPTSRGFEKELKKRLEALKNLRKKKQEGSNS
ncbi:MAG: replication-associated recombination protein A [Simkaniaceae bacterium]